MDFETLSFDNSPFEFVLVGPWQGRDRVLLRSDKSSLDLLGLAAEDPEERLERDGYIRLTDSAVWNWIPFWPISHFRQLNVINSNPADDLDPGFEKRKSIFRFAWVGQCSTIQKRRLEGLFRRSVPDLAIAIKSKHRSDIEYGFSPLFLHCTLANESTKRKRHLVRIVSLIYLVLIIALYVYFMRLSHVSHP